MKNYETVFTLDSLFGEVKKLLVSIALHRLQSRLGLAYSFDAALTVQTPVFTAVLTLMLNHYLKYQLLSVHI